jgi:cytochrome c-type biogenesis protein
MIEALFSWLTDALGDNLLLSMMAAFGWGVLSVVLSPCHLAGIPLVIGYISRNGLIKGRSAVALASSFALGTLVTVAGIGLVTVWLGRMAGDTGPWGTVVVSGVFIAMGLYLMDLLKLNWPSIHLSDEQKGGLTGAFALGLIFGIGLGPCTFAFFAPVLGAVFSLSAENQLLATLLVLAFAFGHVLVVALAGSMTTLVQRYLDWSGKSSLMLYVKRGCGAVVFVCGLYSLVAPLLLPLLARQP